MTINSSRIIEILFRKLLRTFYLFFLLSNLIRKYSQILENILLQKGDSADRKKYTNSSLLSQSNNEMKLNMCLLSINKLKRFKRSNMNSFVNLYF